MCMLVEYRVETIHPRRLILSGVTVGCREAGGADILAILTGVLDPSDPHLVEECLLNAQQKIEMYIVAEALNITTPVEVQIRVVPPDFKIPEERKKLKPDPVRMNARLNEIIERVV